MTTHQAKEIIVLVKDLLSSSSKWKKESEFKEVCKITDEKYTLGCALYLMQLSVMGETKSRSLVMRKIRWKIRRHFILRHGWHPITNFNRHKSTTYQDVMFLLDKTYESF